MGSFTVAGTRDIDFHEALTFKTEGYKELKSRFRIRAIGMLAPFAFSVIAASCK